MSGSISALRWARREPARPWLTDRAVVAVALFTLREISDQLDRTQQGRLAMKLTSLVDQFDPESPTD